MPPALFLVEFKVQKVSPIKAKNWLKILFLLTKLFNLFFPSIYYFHRFFSLLLELFSEDGIVEFYPKLKLNVAKWFEKSSLFATREGCCGWIDFYFYMPFTMRERRNIVRISASFWLQEEFLWWLKLMRDDFFLLLTNVWLMGDYVWLSLHI